MAANGVPIRACLLLAGILVIATPFAARAQLRVASTGDSIIRLDPSARASLPFRIIAAPGLGDRVSIVTDVPAGWRAIAPADLELPRDSMALRVISFFVPPDAAAGSYSIRLRATTGSGAVGVDSALVIVNEQPLLGVDLEYSPVWVSPRDTFALRFRVSNRGNTPLHVGMRLDGSSAVRVHADTSARLLTPGSSFVLETRVTTIRSRSPVPAHTVALAVYAGADTATVTARVEVVAQGAVDGTLRGHAMPGELRLRMSDQGLDGASIRAFASGPLRPGSSTRAELLLQGPHTGYSLFGDPDVYRFSLESRSFSLRLGDHIYALSPLTETGREGVGVAGAVRAGPLEAGGFAQWDRRSRTGGSQQAAFTRVRFGTALALGVNWLHHEEASSRSRDVWSARGTVRAPGGWLTADGEYGSRLDRTAAARSLSLRSSRGPLSLQLRHLRADSAYGGAYAGSMIDAAQLMLRPWRQLFLEASIEDRGSARVLAGSVFSFDEQTGRLAVGYGASVVEARYHSGEGISPAMLTDRAASSLGIRTRVPLGSLFLVPNLEVGRSLDRLTGTYVRFWRAGSRALLTTSTGSYSASFEYFSGGRLHPASAGAGMSASLAASVQPMARTRLSVSANVDLDHSGYAAHLIKATLERELPFGHRLVLRSALRGTASRFDPRETLLTIDYVIPLRVPLMAAPASGRVRGRVYDAATGAPLARVIVEIADQRAATDAHGLYDVRGVAPGTHRVRLDRSSATAGYVPAEPLQSGFVVRGGSTSTLDIGLTPAARIHGRLTIVRQSAAAVAASVLSDAAPEVLGGAVVELSRGSERIRRTTDARGSFDVSDLRPGHWIVTVTGARLPQHYHFERDTVIVDVGPDDQAAIELRAVAVERRIRMVATADLTKADVNTASAPRTSAPSSPPRSSPVRHQPRESAAARPRSVPAQPHGSSKPTPRTAHRDSEPRIADATSTSPRTSPDLPSGWRFYSVPDYVTMLRGVAREVYYETGLWPKIWVANREAVPDPDEVLPGTVLRIPPKAPLTPEELQALSVYMHRPY